MFWEKKKKKRKGKTPCCLCSSSLCFVLFPFFLSGSESSMGLLKLTQLGGTPGRRSRQTGTCVLVSIPLCQPPNWEQLAQRLFYMAEHDRLQLFYCFCFLNGAIWMKRWLELSLPTRRRGVSACQKDTSWKRGGNKRRSRGGHCHQTSRRAVLLRVSDDRARVGYRGGGGDNNKPLISISEIRGCHPRTEQPSFCRIWSVVVIISHDGFS